MSRWSVVVLSVLLVGPLRAGPSAAPPELGDAAGLLQQARELARGQHDSLLSVTVRAVGAAAEADAKDFGPTLEAFLKAYPCQKPQSCRVATAAALQEAVELHLAQLPRRLLLVQSGQARLAHAVEKIRAFALQHAKPGSNLQKFYHQAAAQLNSEHSVVLQGHLSLLGPDSPVVLELRQTQARVEEWSGRIARETDPELRDAYAMKLAKEYAKAFSQIERVEWKLQWARSSLTGTGYDSLEGKLGKASFRLSDYISYGKCDAPYMASVEPRPVLVKEYEGKLSLYEDWKVLEIMLDGPGTTGKPLTLACPFSGRHGSFSYDEITNTLVNEVHENWYWCWPGNCGDLNMGWRRGADEPTKSSHQVAEFLRERFGASP